MVRPFTRIGVPDPFRQWMGQFNLLALGRECGHEIRGPLKGNHQLDASLAPIARQFDDHKGWLIYRGHSTGGLFAAWSLHDPYFFLGVTTRNSGVMD